MIREYIICLILILISTSVSADEIKNYKYPITNPFIATISSNFLRVKNFRGRFHKITKYPQRKKNKIYGKYADFEFSTQIRKYQKRPLMVMFAGTGGRAQGPVMNYLSNLFYKNGYHVLIVPSIVNWQYVAGGSSTSIPGYAPQDAKDQHLLIQKALAYLHNKYSFEVSNIGFLGVSLGALTATHVALEDQAHNILNPKRIILVNPPIDFEYSIRTLDSFYFTNDLSKRQKSLIIGKVINLMGEVDLKEQTLEEIYRKLPFTDKQLKFIIGYTFHLDLVETVLASQYYNDIGVFRNPYTRWNRNARNAEAQRISFVGYIENIVAKFWKPQLPKHLAIKTILKPYDLLGLADQLDNLPIHIVHNKDDFLLNDASRDFINSFNDSAIYPKGGHLGNLWHPMTQGLLIEATNSLFE